MKPNLLISLTVAMVFCGAVVLGSCKKQTSNLIQNSQKLETPPGFPTPTYNFAENPLTDAGFRLGRKLFHDGRLSADGSVSCSSCHQPVAAFTTYEHDRSHGINGNHTLRNAPGLFNLAWHPSFNQDGGASGLWQVYKNHIMNPKEMGETIPGVLNRLKQDTSYKRLFREAFGSENPTEEKLYKALDQFLVNMVSADSKYDKVMQGKTSFTAEEQEGYDAFQAKCAGCHSGILFTDFSFRNIGLEVDPVLNDYGRMMVTGNPADSLKFRVPSLRNLEFTSYYMHDGRINLPRNVLKFYQTGVNQSATLDPMLSNGIALTQEEEDGIIAFLRTLSDSAFLNNPRFRE